MVKTNLEIVLWWQLSASKVGCNHLLRASQFFHSLRPLTVFDLFQIDALEILRLDVASVIKSEPGHLLSKVTRYSGTFPHAGMNAYKKYARGKIRNYSQPTARQKERRF
jgi:hypothetical protein